MKLPWLAWALVGWVVLVGLARAASCQDFARISAAMLSECPEPAPCPTCVPPMEHEVRVALSEAHLGTPIRLLVRTCWSPSTGELGSHATAHVYRADGSTEPSPAVLLGNPEDCIPVPEPPGMLAVGVVALALLGRSRGISQATARPT